MKKTTLRRLYLLFVHYGLKGELNDSNVQRLQNDLGYLSKILEPRDQDKWEGRAFVFIDRGFPALVRNRKDMAEGVDLGAEIQKFITAIEVPSRVTPVTAVQLSRLVKMLGKDLPSESRKSLYTFLTGSGTQMFYDGPKVVEAVLRIANIGRNTPLLRFDDDVIFYGSRNPALGIKARSRKSRETTEQILRLCEHYDSLCQDSRINYFIFSGGYCDQPLSQKVQNPKVSSKEDLLLLNGFATRVVQLAYVPDSKEKELTGLKDKAFDAALEGYSVKISPKSVAYFLKNLYKVGANPFRQVISGAGLCLSDSAILDLPPYSNMRQNVVWIDDHLKYALHHELRHFGFYAGGMQVARPLPSYFEQCRHLEPPTLGDVRWHVRTYLPRMVLGCVADSWLRADPKLKRSFANLGAAQVAALLELIPGTYTSRFLDMVASGWQSQDERRQFSQELWQLALHRLNDVVNFFKSKEFAGTFLQMFVLGSKSPIWRKFFSEFVPDGMEAEIERLPQRYSGKLRKKGKRASPESLQGALETMVEDFIEYIEFVRFWRNFVFSVRSLLNWRDMSNIDEIEWLVPGVVSNR